MNTYSLPTPITHAAAQPRAFYTVASGDLRLAANVRCWPTQQRLERNFARALESLGWSVKRALSRDGSRELFAGKAMPHFNEVDEGVAVDALVTNRIRTAMGLDPATTLHDVRWGDEYDGEFVRVFEISGAVPASHNGGYDKSYSIMDGILHADLGRGHVVVLPEAETQRRLNATDPQWPNGHAGPLRPRRPSLGTQTLSLIHI